MNKVILLVLISFSVDLDTLAFGDTPLIRHFFSRVHPILFIDPVIARKQLGLSKRSFIDFCILCGTDFSGTIQGVGPIRALQYITKYKKIETLLKNLNPKYTPQPEFDYKLARRVNIKSNTVCVRMAHSEHRSSKVYLL